MTALLFGLSLLTAPVASYQQDAPQSAISHTFTLVPPRPAKKVNLAGAFNGWDKAATPMTLGADGKTWTITVPLKPGKYGYKFVLDGEEWITDPHGRNEGDGNGNTNSILLIVPGDYVGTASPNDGVIATSALQHVTQVPYLNFDHGRLTLSLRTRPNDLANTAVVVKGLGTFPMTGVNTDEFYRLNTASIPWDRKGDLVYHFELTDGGKTFDFGPNGIGAGDFKVSAKEFRPFEVPNWVEKGVIYQIFPDRFDNGDKKNDPANVVPWNSVPTYGNHFGGDIAGVRKHLGYLKALGISTVYFNPVFQSSSNHRYDTIDYLKIDPEIGTNEEFGQVTREMKRMGIRTVVDGVFNHTATKFFAFNDVVQKGAKSPYTKWYTFQSFPVKVQENPNYVAWFNYPSMPKINQANPETRAYLLNVPKFWAKNAAIAGWRLDVANEVPMDYWRDFRKTVKKIDRNNWILGEEWGDANRWLTGDQWDSVMDYPFRGAILDFVGKDGGGKPSQLLSSLMGVYGMYAPQVSRNAMNLLGSHDTPRIRTMCGGDADLAKLAAAIQFTWPGTPSIYYGDELGMEGDKDPDNRRVMDWPNASSGNPFLSFYQRLIQIRNETPALQSGDPVVLSTDDGQGTAVYGRVLDGDKGEVAIVAINRSSEARQVTISAGRLTKRTISFIDALGDRKVTPTGSGNLLVNLAPKSAAVLIPQSGLSLLSRPGAGMHQVPVAPSAL